MTLEILDPAGFNDVPAVRPTLLFARTPEAQRARDAAEEARSLAMARWAKLNPPCACHAGTAIDAWTAAEDEDRRRREAAAMRRLQREQWRTAGLPERVLRTLDGATEDTEARRIAHGYATGQSTFLVLVGGPGTGKTTAAVEVLMGLAKPSSGMFVPAGRCGRLSLFDDDDRLLLENMQRIECLVLDDLGTEFLSENSVWRGLVDGLLDARYAAMKRTIITTNLDLPAFGARYGKRVADRLRHDMVLGMCGAKSMRSPKGAA